MGKSACIAFAAGCPRAQVDTALLFDYFRANGWDLTEEIEDADVVIVTGCAADRKNEDSCLPLLEVADRRRKPGSTLLVVGCMGGIVESRILERFDAVAMPPTRYEILDDLIGATVKLHEVPDPHDIPPRIREAAGHFHRGEGHPNLLWRLGAARVARKSSYLEPLENRYTVRVAEGCRGECSYCAIRRACGPLRSKAFDVVLAEFDAGLADGRRDFRLIAQDLGSYGQDLGTDIVELLRAMFERDADFSVQLIDLNTRWLVDYSDSLVPLITANAQRIGHLAVPLQSGSDRILALMRRGHSASDARRVLGAIRAGAPGLVMSTHIMVGFPGETEQDFQDTLEMLRAIRFDRVDVYDYTDRPGTAASSMGDKVPRNVLTSRSSRVRKEFRGRSGIIAVPKYWLRTQVEERVHRRRVKDAAAQTQTRKR